MNAMLRWSPTRQFHFHHEADDLFERFFAGARDEVAHGRMGWAHLAREAARYDVSFLSSWIPAI